MKEFKYTDIKCPRCKEKIGTHDGVSTIPKLLKCRDCAVGVKFYPINQTTRIIKLPSRKESSGTRFY